MPVKSKAAKARRAEWRRAYDAKRLGGRSGKKRSSTAPLTVAIDGEGVGAHHHRYVMLSWADNRGRCDTLEAPLGGDLGTHEVLSWLDRTLPRTARIFGFSLGYDWGCIFRDLDEQSLYRLEHVPDRQFRKHRRKIVTWKGWQIDKRGQRLAFRRGRHGKWRVVWDTFRFYAKSFVWAIGPKGWNVATPEELAEIESMKERRGAFRDSERDEMRHYNVLECRLHVKLTLALIQAHKDAGLPLRTFYGPGSTATEMFEQMVGGKKYFKPLQALAKEWAPELQEAIASAFFGGRFEHRVIGEVTKVHEYDINSAYPDVISRLPCMQHGQWERIEGDRVWKLKRKQTAVLVKYRLASTTLTPSPAWGPFPFREKDGSISFPIESGGGWVCWDEWLMADDLALWPNIIPEAAWVYHRDCDCAPPFARVAEWYLERLRVGKKTGAGNAYKLGYNSCYGKLAQSIGRAPLNFWLYAAMITAGCRARALGVLEFVRPSDLLAFATDGILLRREVSELPVSEKLGEWSHTEVERAFLVRPGIVFGSLEKTRGLGVKAARDVKDAAIAHWNKHHDLAGGVSGPPASRFCGIKLGVRKTAQGAYVRNPRFGHWYPRPTTVGFDPMPKRDGFDGTKVGAALGLRVRRFPLDQRSVPYDRASVSDDAKLLRAASDEADDQPDPGDDE